MDAMLRSLRLLNYAIWKTEKILDFLKCGDEDEFVRIRIMCPDPWSKGVVGVPFGSLPMAC